MSDPTWERIRHDNALLSQMAINANLMSEPKHGFREALKLLYHQCKEVEHQQKEIAKLKAELAEFNALFDLQHTRMNEAIAAWRKAHPGNELVSPDLGRLLDWLLSKDKS